MKNLYSTLSYEREDPGYTTLPAISRPEKIRIMFEDDGSAGSVEILYKNNSAPAPIYIPNLNNQN